MFKELYGLALQATLAMTISADEASGTMTINVIPKPKKEGADPALSTPLTLTASPDEFAADFVGALSSFSAKRKSLAEQAELTNEVLSAAREASAKKGTTAVAKAVAKAPTKAAPVRAATEEDDADTDVQQDAPQAAAPAGAATGAGVGMPDLFE